MIRLLYIHTLEFTTFDNDSTPPYAAASHRWQDEETTYEHFMKEPGNETLGQNKVLSFCAYVVTHAFDIEELTGRSVDWLWIDTCCIDKRDPNELHEAINSMFDWYARADICFAYLYDVESNQRATESSWFERGWTLEELLAPSLVVFLDKSWQFRGVKRDSGFRDQRTGMSALALYTCPQYWPGLVLNNDISKRTGIPQIVLFNLSLIHTLHFNDILQWMAKRITTKWEDRAYCLLGLMDVAMSPNYGEYEHAMIRLLDQIRDKYSRQIRAIERTGRSQPSAKSVKAMQQEINLIDEGADMWLEQRAARRDQNRTRHDLPRNMQHERPHSAGLGTSSSAAPVGGYDDAGSTDMDPQTQGALGSTNVDALKMMLHQFNNLQQQQMYEDLDMQKAQAFCNPLELMSRRDATS